jgi:EAL domain-containing protein (putative c-di-GMP-specific phosphodiesterase class I)
MYQAKDLGRNGYQIYAPAMSAGILRRLTLEKDLRRAVQREEFVLHYQPIADVATGEVVGVEALVRWQHPERGLLLPGDFIPFAEETGLIQPIDTWVLGTACRQAMSWQGAGLPPLRVAVNISARLFLQPDMVDMVAEVLRESGLAPDLLELEITETLAMENADLSIQVLASLDQMGVHVAIDDFGTGYSSLSYLKDFPIDTVKIDRAFVSGVIGDVNDAASASASIAMAHKLNLEVTAEGVETEEELAFLREHSCDHYQGYLLSRPVPAGEIPRLLQGAGSERASVPSSSC